jgi:acid phosphatase family membrane protein YuiD
VVGDPSYLLIPFIAWFVAGVTKFVVNSVRAQRLAVDLIGYGGLPSNHSAIVTSAVVLVALREGIDHPAVAVAAALAFVVMLDASSLRRQVGRQAAALNQLGATDPAGKPLRERMGHTRIEIGAGIAVGAATASVVDVVAQALG